MSEWIPPGHRPHDGHPDDDVRWCECSGRCTQGAPCDCCELAELRAEVERLAERIALAVAFCDEFSGVQVAVTTARILRGGS